MDLIASLHVFSSLNCNRKKVQMPHYTIDDSSYSEKSETDTELESEWDITEVQANNASC